MKQEIGMSPDEFLFRGEKKIDEVLIRLIDFDAHNLKEESLKKISDSFKYQNTDTITWLNIDGLHNHDLMEEIASGLNLDPIILAGVMNTHGRPTVKEYNNCIFVSLKMLSQNFDTDKINFENLSLIVTKSMLISFQERRGDVFEPVRDRLRNQKKRIRNGKTDYLLFALLDIVIDNYIYSISLLGDKIETLEEKILVDPGQEIIAEINSYKRELNFLRKNIKPAKEMVLGLLKLDSDFIDEVNHVHFKELQDNINQASDFLDSYREIVSDQLNIHHTTISSNLNDIMKFLTVFSVVFIPLTFIAGIYGTNFDFVPELHYKYSYFIMWAVIVVIAISMLIYFKKKKWL
ncbi:magnesium/cobalt transporter CorA [uncultured Flavobacterium sp.]|uniref:magnesium/cobalt transporter CorA n=1 Tax=uncultured Flavobacterium sp. TaxID=165435 RepID=UPI0030CA4E5C